MPQVRKCTDLLDEEIIIRLIALQCSPCCALFIQMCLYSVML